MGTNREWRLKINELENLYKSRNIKAFHCLLNKITKIKSSCPVVQHIVDENGETISCANQRD